MTVRTIQVPVNAASERDARMALTHEMRARGLRLVGIPAITREPLRPFARVAIDCKGADACYLLTVEYVKAEGVTR